MQELSACHVRVGQGLWAGQWQLQHSNPSLVYLSHSMSLLPLFVTISVLSSLVDSFFPGFPPRTSTVFTLPRDLDLT